jgi:hypothetical protein
MPRFRIEFDEFDLNTQVYDSVIVELGRLLRFGIELGKGKH